MDHLNATKTHILVVGASSAIVHALSRLYACEGAHFLLVARDADKLEILAGDLKVLGATQVHTLVMDLGDPKELYDFGARVRAVLQGIDLCILGHGVLGPLTTEAHNEAFLKSLVVNYVSPVLILESLAPYFEQSKRGSIIVLGSVAGDRGRASNYLYGSAKAGLHAYVSGLRARLVQAGASVKVLLVKPGPVATPMTAHLPQGPLFAQVDKVAKDIYKAEKKGYHCIYTPGIWRWIMLVFKLLPEFLFMKLKS